MLATGAITTKIITGNLLNGGYRALEDALAALDVLKHMAATSEEDLSPARKALEWEE